MTGYCGGRVEVSHNHLSVERSNPGSFYNFRYMALISFAGHCRSLHDEPPAMSSDVKPALTLVSPLVPLGTRAISRFHRTWPVVAMAIAVIVNLGWLGFLGAEFFKLIEAAFF